MNSISPFWKRVDLTSVQFQNRIALALVAFFILFEILSVQKVSMTNDEFLNDQYGMNILNLNSNRIVRGKGNVVDDSKMPITALNAVPAKLAESLPNNGFKNFLGDLNTARFVTVIFSTLAAWLVFSWSRSLYGFVPSLISLFLYIFDPNIIAHSELVTNDLYCVGAVLFSSWCLWKFANQRSVINGLILAFALALSQITKYTAVALYPLAVSALLLYDMPALIDACKKRAMRVLGSYFLKYAVYICVAVLVLILVLNVGYVFNRTFTPLGIYDFGSRVFRAIQFRTIKAVPVLRGFPLPTPYPYLQGLDQMLVTNSTGARYGPVYLLGQVHTDGKGFMGYYFVASFLKVPIATQIIVLGAILVYLMDGKRRERFLSNEVFFLVPVVFYTIYFNFLLNAQVGIRYYLIVFPLLYVFAGSLFVNWPEFSFKQKAAGFLLALYLIVSVLSYYPFYLSYFNEFVWDRKYAYKFLADSNLDWNQGEYYLQTYLNEHPNAVYLPSQPMSGMIIVPDNFMAGLSKKRDPVLYSLLRNDFQPTETIAYEYLVFDISPDKLKQVCSTTTDCR